MSQVLLQENDILLTTDQVAKLYKTSRQTITNWINSGKLNAQKHLCNKGRGGVAYLIPLSELDDRTQTKYWKSASPDKKPKAPEVNQASKQIDQYSAEERRVIQQWVDAIKAWQLFRAGYRGSLSDADRLWIENNARKYDLIDISTTTLYRRWKAFKENDYDGLIDKRGKWAKGTNSIPEIAWEVFKFYYLDEAQHPVSKCVQYTEWYVEKEMPELLQELPSYHAFNRAVKTIPEAVVKLYREGNKAFEDEAAPYITRQYEALEVNEVWVADAHTLDIMTIENNTEKIHRLTVVAFADARSRMIVGWHITNNTSSEAVLMALRKGILKYGIPRNILVDNGTEFLCYDIGGRGHRRKRKDDGTHIPPGVFARLGIDMWNAQVKNAKAKIIERIFREFKENFSRLVTGFCGGNPLERPEKLKKTVKTRKGMLLDHKLIETFETYIDGMYNMTSSKGMGMYGRSPKEVYNEELFEKRVATEEDLNLMLMRSTRMQTVSRNGVHIEISGEKLYYWTPEFLIQYQGRSVYLRYDPEDLKSVRIYNEDDVYQCTVPIDNDTILKYGASKDDVKKALQKIRQFKKTVKEYNEKSGLDAYTKLDALDLMLWKAKKNIEESDITDTAQAKVLEVVRSNEPVTNECLKVDETAVDMQRMINNSKKNAM